MHCESYQRTYSVDEEEEKSLMMNLMPKNFKFIPPTCFYIHLYRNWKAKIPFWPTQLACLTKNSKRLEQIQKAIKITCLNYSNKK